MESLYKAWFTDFIPFDGNRPANWEKSDIYSIADIIYGAPFASKLFNTDGEGMPIIRIRDLKEQAFVTYTTEKHPKGHLIQPGDIIVGMDMDIQVATQAQMLLQLQQSFQVQQSIQSILEGVLVPSGRAFSVELVS